MRRINQILTNLYSAHRFLLQDGALDDKEKQFFESVDVNMDETTATMAIHQLSLYLSRHYQKKSDYFTGRIRYPYAGGLCK